MREIYYEKVGLYDRWIDWCIGCLFWNHSEAERTKGDYDYWWCGRTNIDLYCGKGWLWINFNNDYRRCAYYSWYYRFDKKEKMI